MKRIAALSSWVICLALFAFAVAVSLPWIIAENARLEPWKIPIIWLSEFTAFILFIEYGLRQVFPSDRTVSGITIKAFIVATVFDLGLSALSIRDEESAHSRALPAQGTVVAGHSRLQNSGHTRYTFDCRFRDQQGVQYAGWFSYVNDGVPIHVRTAIDQQQLPANVAIAYDPRWPVRSWLADVPYSYDNRLFIYSLLTIMFSVILAGALAVFRQSMSWLPHPRVAPFLGATWILCMGAFLQGGW